MSYNGVREWIEVAERHGELLKMSGAHWDLEMSSIAEIVYREGKGPNPVLLFDDIPDYPKGYRTLFGLLASPWSIATSLGLPEDQLDSTSLLQNWREKVRELRLIPPKFVTSGPVLANSDTGDKIDLLKFPSPRFHELDTPNRYIGTACNVIQKDPDSGYVNLGAYRNMVVDRNRLTTHAIEGQHGSIIMYEKYFAQGRVMPIAIALGVDPALYLASGFIAVPWGISEYDYAGGIKGEPIEVIEGPYTGLPLPAHAEIIIEGECHPGDEADEGPFGEWHGYYANLGLATVSEPVIRVKAVHYRDDPILTCAQETVPPHDDCLVMGLMTAERIWSGLEGFGIPGIKNVWCHEIGHGYLFNVISIKQLYAGHSSQIGAIACQYPFIGRYTIVVDEDIDPSNLEEVIWAMVTRAPADQAHIQILERCRSGSHDPAIPLAEKMKYRVPPKPLYSSRVFINACRDYEHKADWYPIARVSPELRTKILDKWQAVLSKVV